MILILSLCFHLGLATSPLVNRLIITEIMYDPTPSVGLPEAEYIELWNPGPSPVNLSRWYLQVGEKKRVLETASLQVLNPGEYLILCSESNAPLFSDFCSANNQDCNVHPIESWPTLSNTGNRITLISPVGSIMHSMEYGQDSWLDALKASGGWSLELIDPDQYCRQDNWAASRNPMGGTPGMPNSITAQLKPGEAPSLLRAILLPANRFGLLFSGPIDPLLSPAPINCTLYPGAVQTDLVFETGLGSSMLNFELPDGLDAGLRYKIHLNQPVFNCTGQMAVVDPQLLAFPQNPDSGDLVINEIMFDPLEGSSEWVELYNRSNKVIEVSDLILAKGYAEITQDEEVIITDFSNQQELPFQLFPASYCILIRQYRRLEGHPGESRELPEQVIITRPDLPSLPNSFTILVLMNRTHQEIDRAIYSPDMHYPLIRETKGVSLERITPEASGNNPNNWFSAADGNSAGHQNSNTSTGSTNPAEEPFRWVNKPGIPVVVRYAFNDPGWFARICIYDRFGHPVRKLSEGAVLALEGVINWDGLSDRQTPLPPDIYVIVVDYMHPDGRRGRWRSAIALHR